MLQFLTLLLQAEATATISGEPTQVLEPIRHNLKEKAF
jgi:hypothetical protein